MSTPEDRDSRRSEETTPDSPSGLSPEEIKKLKAAQKRNVIFAIIGGLILAVLGFFAGQNLRDNQTDDSLMVVDIVAEYGIEERL